MSIVDLFESSEHRNNVAHFAAILNLAYIDGKLDDNEQEVINKFVKKLDITDEEYQEVLNHPENYPIIPQNSSEKRLEMLFDLFKIIFADHEIDAAEKKLVLNYALKLGCSVEKADSLINKSIKIFSGKFDFEEYKLLLSQM